MPRLVDAEMAKVLRRRWLVDIGFLTAMIFCVTLFIIGLALYVVMPAARTLLH